MDKFITDTEKLFDEQFPELFEKTDEFSLPEPLAAYISKDEEVKQFLKSKLQEAWSMAKKESDEEYGDFANRMNNSLNKCEKETKQDFKQQLIEKIEGLHDIGCEIQRAGRCSCPVYKIINIIKEI